MDVEEMLIDPPSERLRNVDGYASAPTSGTAVPRVCA